MRVARMKQLRAIAERVVDCPRGWSANGRRRCIISPFTPEAARGVGGEASLPSSVSASAAVATPRIAAGPLLRNRARPPPGLRYTVVRRCAARRIALGHENRRMLL